MFWTLELYWEIDWRVLMLKQDKMKAAGATLGKFRWANVPKEERVAAMRTLIRARWDKTAPENRGDAAAKAWETRRKNAKNANP
jgi:hypothetical protein